MALFPFFIDIKEKKALLIGGGKHALEKIEKLRPFEVRLQVIATEVCKEIEEDSTVELLRREFSEGDLTEDLPDEPVPTAKPTLPQTGQLWWPVPLLACGGLVLLILGWLRKERYEG